MRAKEARQLVYNFNRTRLNDILSCIEKAAGEGKIELHYPATITEDERLELLGLGYRVVYIDSETIISW